MKTINAFILFVAVIHKLESNFNHPYMKPKNQKPKTNINTSILMLNVRKINFSVKLLSISSIISSLSHLQL